MDSFDRSKLKRRTVIYASDVLGVVHLKDIYFDCPGAAKFYAWANQVIEIFFMTYVEGATEDEQEYMQERYLSMTETETEEDMSSRMPRRRVDLPSDRVSSDAERSTATSVTNGSDDSRSETGDSESTQPQKVTKFAPIPEIRSMHDDETQSLGPKRKKKIHITISEN